MAVRDSDSCPAALSHWTLKRTVKGRILEVQSESYSLKGTNLKGTITKIELKVQS